jgi:hypothetical protein
MDISALSAKQLLKLHADIEGQLRKLNIISSANNPAGDLAETLFCKAFDWDRADKSQAHYDAKGKKDGLLYQIKCRRIVGDGSKGSRQLSAIRGLEQTQHFNVLAVVLFNEDYSVNRAAFIPHTVLLSLDRERKHISFQKHTNSHRFLLVDDVWKVPGVRDVTAELMKAQESM